MENVITLLSDWRLRDPYVAMLKGRILSAIQGANIIDISHYVDKFNILQEALLMKNSYKAFPQGSIHFLLVNTLLDSDYQPVVFQYDGHCFIGEDNGVFHMMFGDDLDKKGRKLTNPSGNTVSDMLEIVRLLSNGVLEKNTEEYSVFKRMFVENVEYLPQERQIVGKIVYIDAFNNAVTDISSELFNEMVGDKPFTATIQSKGEWTITKHSNKYEEIDNEMFIMDNAMGLIEISSYQADVAILADLDLGDIVTVTF